MFLRLIGAEIDLRSGRRKGIFTLAYELRDSNSLLSFDEIRIRELLVWFSDYLPKPTKFSKSKNSKYKNNISTAWFKDEANEMISKVWKLKKILEEHSIHIEVILSEKPGSIIYEDDFQVIVEPF